MTSSVEKKPYAERTAGMLLWLLGFMLVFAPLFRAGHLPIALLVLQLSAILLFLLALWTPGADSLSNLEAFALALVILLPALYFLPVPGLTLDWLPGRERYLEALALIGQDHTQRASTLSLYPLESESAWLTLLVPVAVFVGTRRLDFMRQNQLIFVLIAIAAVQAVFGLMQFGRGADSPLYLGLTHTHFGSAVGTYTNRNHLAGLIEMVLPIALALFLYSLGRRERHDFRDWRRRLLFFSTFRGHVAFFYGALALLLIVGMIFTQSRTGIALTMLAVVLVTFAFGRRLGGDNIYGAAGTVVAFAIGIGIAIGLAPVLDRFASADLSKDARWTVFSASLDGIRNFFPIGSGPGTFPDVFHAFHPIELGNYFINHAHNDYLEWLFESGVVAAFLIALMLGLYFLQWRKVWTNGMWSRFRFVQVGAGIGVFLLLLHELVDYNLFIPANMVVFAFLAGIFFSDPGQQVATGSRRRKKRRTRNLEKITALDASTVRPMGPAPDQIKNPFLD